MTPELSEAVGWVTAALANHARRGGDAIYIVHSTVAGEGNIIRGYTTVRLPGQLPEKGTQLFKVEVTTP